MSALTRRRQVSTMAEPRRRWLMFRLRRANRLYSRAYRRWVAAIDDSRRGGDEWSRAAIRAVRGGPEEAGPQATVERA